MRENLGAVESAQSDIFGFLSRIPASTYIYAMMGSIVASAAMYLLGRRQTALFIGEWAPTFAVVGLFYKLLRPSGLNPVERTREAFGEFTR